MIALDFTIYVEDSRCPFHINLFLNVTSYYVWHYIFLIDYIFPKLKPYNNFNSYIYCMHLHILSIIFDHIGKCCIVYCRLRQNECRGLIGPASKFDFVFILPGARVHDER